MLTNRSGTWPQHVTRRHVLSVGLSVAAVSLAGCSASRAVGGRNSSAPASAPAAAGVSTLPPDVSERLRGLEGASSRRIGVSLEAEDQRLRVGYRQDERFAMCSTYKVFVVACVFARIADLGEIIHYSNRELVEYSPITGLHVSTGLSVRELCAAAIEVSDNTAANLLLRRVGGPTAVTAYLRAAVDDRVTHLDRYEPAVNLFVRGDLRDTSTPRAMAESYGKLTGGRVLPADRTGQLRALLAGCTTGLQQIRAVAPSGWMVGDKTGHGDHGTANDVAILTAPHRSTTVTLAVCTDATQEDAANRDDVVREAARITLAHLS